MPNFRACFIDAMDSLSSWGPQLKAHPPPPMAHAPKPTVVIWIPLDPSGRVCKLMITPPNSLSKKKRWHALHGNQFILDRGCVPVKRMTGFVLIFCRQAVYGRIDSRAELVHFRSNLWLFGFLCALR